MLFKSTSLKALNQFIVTGEAQRPQSVCYLHDTGYKSPAI